MLPLPEVLVMLLLMAIGFMLAIGLYIWKDYLTLRFIGIPALTLAQKALWWPKPIGKVGLWVSVMMLRLAAFLSVVVLLGGCISKTRCEKACSEALDYLGNKALELCHDAIAAEKRRCLGMPEIPEKK